MFPEDQILLDMFTEGMFTQGQPPFGTEPEPVPKGLDEQFWDNMWGWGIPPTETREEDISIIGYHSPNGSGMSLTEVVDEADQNQSPCSSEVLRRVTTGKTMINTEAEPKKPETSEDHHGNILSSRSSSPIQSDCAPCDCPQVQGSPLATQHRHWLSACPKNPRILKVLCSKGCGHQMAARRLDSIEKHELRCNGQPKKKGGRRVAVLVECARLETDAYQRMSLKDRKRKEARNAAKKRISVQARPFVLPTMSARNEKKEQMRRERLVVAALEGRTAAQVRSDAYAKWKARKQLKLTRWQRSELVCGPNTI